VGGSAVRFYYFRVCDKGKNEEGRLRLTIMIELYDAWNDGGEKGGEGEWQQQPIKYLRS